VTASLTNTITVSGIGNPDGLTHTDTASAQVIVNTPLAAQTAPRRGTTSKPATIPTPTTAAISIANSPTSQTVASGGTATFTITVTNTGFVPLKNVTVSDPSSTRCSRSLGTIPAYVEKNYTCTHAGVDKGFKNVATVTAVGPTGKKMSASDHSLVELKSVSAGPRIAVAVSPRAQTLLMVTHQVRLSSRGSSTAHSIVAHFTITVTNAGTTPLVGVTVNDPLAPACDSRVGNIARGGSAHYSCASKAVTRPFTNVVAVTGKSPSGKTVSSSDQATVKLAQSVSHTARGLRRRHGHA
jgi:hypothetical protein